MRMFTWIGSALLLLFAATPSFAQDCVDQDLDSFCVEVDCDDTDPDVYPGAPEIPGNEIDEDCDGFEVCYQDLDGDSFGTATLIESLDLDCRDANESRFTGDCDDSNDRIYPGATEIVGNGIDESCDGNEICYRDLDGDGFGAGIVVSEDIDCEDEGESTTGQDCDDTRPDVYPGAPEDPTNGIDDNCDGVGDPVSTDDISWSMLKARY